MVKNDQVLNPTQERILQSAREIFMTRGLEGARMQHIADHAGINKALLHYYFRNKETLFGAVFTQTVRQLLPALTEVFLSDRPLLEKIPEFFKIHIGFIQANPLIPQFILSEISRNPEMILNGFKAFKQNGILEKFAGDVEASIRKGEIKPVDPVQLILNLISLSVFPFIAKPIIIKILDMDESKYQQMLEDRKNEVTQFVINSLR